MTPAAQRIEIGVAADAAFLEPAYVLLASLGRWHVPGSLRVHLMSRNLAPADREGLRRFAADRGIQLDAHVVRPSELTLSGRVTPHVAYTRLSLPDRIDDGVGRLVVLDLDAVVLAPLHELWDTPMGDAAVLGVRDLYVATALEIPPPAVPGRTGNLPARHGHYINSGVLVIDLRRWRERKLRDRLLAEADRLGPDVPLRDQDLINALPEREIGHLDPRWNLHGLAETFAAGDTQHPVYSRSQMRRAIARPGIVHYAGTFEPHKPRWALRFLAGAYLWYRRRTPFAAPASGLEIMGYGAWIAAPALHRFAAIHEFFYRHRGQVRRLMLAGAHCADLLRTRSSPLRGAGRAEAPGPPSTMPPGVA